MITMSSTAFLYPFEVTELTYLTPSIIQIFAKSLSANFLYQAGQYIEIQSPNNNFLPFTIANAPNEKGIIELHIRHWQTDELISAFIRQTQSTQKLFAKGPFGKVSYQTNPQPIIFLAGGTGFAQAKAIIEFIEQSNNIPPIHLYWGVRTVSDFYLPEYPKLWLNKLPQFKYTALISQPEKNPDWRGLTGYTHIAAIKDYPSLEKFKVYVSGPFAMVQAAYHLFLKHGLQPQNLFSDMLALSTQ